MCVLVGRFVDASVSSITRTCAASGAWSTATLQCVRVQCPLPVLPISATFGSNCPSSERTFGGACTARCAVGFEGTPVSYTCGSNSVLAPDQGAPISCTAIQCTRASLLAVVNPDSSPALGTGSGVDQPASTPQYVPRAFAHSSLPSSLETQQQC